MTDNNKPRSPTVPDELLARCKWTDPTINEEMFGKPGLLVIGEVRSVKAEFGSGLLLSFTVDFTTHAGRRTIADVAQWAMTNGCGLYTRPRP